MIPEINKALAHEKFEQAIALGDDDLVVQAWEVQYMSRFLSYLDLLGYKPNPDDPPRPWPWPWPWPWFREDRFGGVLEVFEKLSDPTPETARVLDAGLQRAAAKNVITQLRQSADRLEKELSL